MGFKVPLSLHPNSFGKGSRPKPHELLKSQERYLKWSKQFVKEGDTVEITRMNENDFEECAALFYDVFTGEPWNDGWRSVEHVKTYLTEIVDQPTFEGFKVCESGKIIGACIGHKRTWWTGIEFTIDEMYISTDNQRQGIGTELIEFVKNELLNKGIQRIILLTGKGLPAESFYHKNGFYNSPRMTLMICKLE